MLKYVGEKSKKEFANDLKTIYQAPSEDAALEQLERVTEKWEKDYPNAMKSWYKNWDVISPIFKFSADVRKVIYTTNAIESLNSGYRRLNKQRSVFPSDTALLKALYLATHEIAKKWNVSERSVRNYCAQGRVDGVFLNGKTWNIPENAEKPERSNKKKEQPITLLDILQEQKASKYSGGIYHKTQIDLTYNSNHIEGSRLTHDQTRYIFETNTIGVEKDVLNVDDVIETANHFRCIDMIIDNAKAVLTEKFIKELHLILKSGTSDSRKDWFAVGDYKKIPNEVGGMDTALPEEVADKMKTLLTEYNGKEEKNFEDILDFHVKFERIHPFQDGNGRVGRLIMFKECLKYNIVPFIIEDNLKMFYYRGLKEWNNEKGYLTDTCLTAQDKYKAYLDYFRIAY